MSYPGSQYRDAVWNTPGLVSLLRMDAASGTTETDQTGAHNGTYSGTVTLGQPGALIGDTDTAVSFGANGAMQVASAFILAGLTNSSVEFWIKRSSAPAADSYIYSERGSSGANLFQIDLPGNSGGVVRFQYRDNGSTYNTVSGAKSVTDNNWHHVVVTKVGTAVVIYVDAGQDRTTTLTATNAFTNPGPQAWVGHDQINNTYLNASVDEVALYSAGLSWARVVQHYRVANGLEERPSWNAEATYTATSQAAGKTGSLAYGPLQRTFDVGWAITNPGAVVTADPYLQGALEQTGLFVKS